MTFFSLEFSILMILFFALYWFFNHHKVQNFLILIFSYFIYILINPYFALILFIYTFFIYYFSLVIFIRRKKYLFLACIALVILNLCFFKYFSSIKDSFDQFLLFLGFDFLNSDVIFPMGISFYTFASITYLTEVYKKHKIQTFLDLCTYLSFFPTLLMGPIMRSEFFFAQAHKKRKFENADLILILLLFGIVKKVLIANYLGIYAKEILDNPSNYNFLDLLCAIYAFSVQIYCDFSGYVDLVCAFALMLGFTLPPNFNMPYLAKNLKEFWQRWHISLSTFIRDFIYIPLGGSKKGLVRTLFNLLIAFALSGIWHGNTINFLIWGLLHGAGVVFLHFFAFKKYQFKYSTYLGRFITFHYVSFAWIFFYYANFEDALLFLNSCVQNFTQPNNTQNFTILLSFAASFLLYPYLINLKENCVKIFIQMPLFLKPFVLAFVLILIFKTMPSGIPNFIYSSF
ncbi:MBOAT family O-acyltransferase [Campylobacter sp. CCS1377]|uniref:MBOAT family O-acyltransferase n=1 Tax=Campylobacter sp. CCS1377 TaxID=3158229 RepID=A0AAU7EAI2_9BACT